MELDTGRDEVSFGMSDAHSHIRHLKHRWSLEDAARDRLEREARQAFLEQEANQLFAPIETYLSKLDKILQAAKALVEIDPTWEHLGDQRLRRSARLIFGASAQHLLLDLTIEGVTVSYRNTPYRFARGIEALIAVITSDVEEFITAQSQGTN
jgi:hypothetical protein